MTKVTIKQPQASKEAVVHQIGNWYKYKGDYFILCDIEDGAVLIDLSGGYFSGPIYDRVNHGNLLTQYDFDSCCGGFSSDFHLVSSIAISEG